MQAALARKVDTILVYKIDRWGRSLINLVTSIGQLTAAGVRFIATTQGIETDIANPAARLQGQILGAVAEFERELIRERVLAGMKKAREDGTRSGKPIGRPKRIFNRAQVLKMRAAGSSLAQISAATGLPKTTIRRVL